MSRVPGTRVLTNPYLIKFSYLPNSLDSIRGTAHCGRMFGRNTARKRPKRARIGFTAIGLGLEQDPRTIEYGTRSIQSMIPAWVLLVLLQ
jgi:hypothetical protein